MSFKNRYELQQKKRALEALKELHARIYKGELIVDSCGFYQGLPGTYTLKVSVKESDKFKESK